MNESTIIRPPACKMCGLEGKLHFAIDQCVRDLQTALNMNRHMLAKCLQELDAIRAMLLGVHRGAYIILDRLTKGKTKGRLTVPAADFEKTPDGAAITMAALESGDFQFLAVLPEKKEEAKPC